MNEQNKPTRILRTYENHGCRAMASNNSPTTLLYSDLFPIFNPNTFSTEYNCFNCGKRFWIARKAELIEEYVFKEGNKTRRVRKT